MTVHVPASRDREAEGGKNAWDSMKGVYCSNVHVSSLFRLARSAHGENASASGADMEPGSVDVGDKASPHYRCISTISTASCSSMVYAPSKQRMGQGSVLSHRS